MTFPAIPSYAQALVELMERQNLLDITSATAQTLTGFFKDRELTLFIKHTLVPPQEKKALLQKMVPPGTPREFINFLNLVVDRGWGRVLPEILETVVRLTILKQGYEIVTLISAQPLTEEEKRMIQDELEAVWQVEIYPEFRVNPNLLGGIVIQRGDKLYDGSLQGQLDKIKKVLINQDQLSVNRLKDG